MNREQRQPRSNMVVDERSEQANSGSQQFGPRSRGQSLGPTAENSGAEAPQPVRGNHDSCSDGPTHASVWARDHPPPRDDPGKLVPADFCDSSEQLLVTPPHGSDQSFMPTPQQVAVICSAFRLIRTLLVVLFVALPWFRAATRASEYSLRFLRATSNTIVAVTIADFSLPAACRLTCMIQC